MRQRLAAWMALLAMLTGITAPAHAHRFHASPDAPGADFCSTVKPAQALPGNIANPNAGAPASPERGHAAVQCDACCGCGGVAAAFALPRSLPTLAAAPAVSAVLPAMRQPSVAGFALARGPPKLS